MSTVKDIARLAGVSLGTVSNVINGKTNNQELIDKVEQAMQALSYRPDTKARSLKSAKSNIIGVMLPDAIQAEYSLFLNITENLFREKGYDIFVKFSNNNRYIEKKNIERFYSHGVDGIVIYSNTNRSNEFHDSSTGIPTVLISRNEIDDFSGEQIVLNFLPALEQAFNYLQERDRDNIAIIIEKDLMESSDFRRVIAHYKCDNNLVKIVDSKKESGFSAFFQLYNSNQNIQAVIAGSYLIAQGVNKALSTIGLNDIDIIAIKESSWIEDENTFCGQISIITEDVCKLAVDKILGSLGGSLLHNSRNDVMQAEFQRAEAVHPQASGKASGLRFAMMDGATARSLDMLLKVYEKSTGAKIDLDLLTYDSLRDTLFQHASRCDSYYDGFMVDVPWLPYIAQTGCIENLDDTLKNNSVFRNGFSDEILDKYASYKSSIYAVPFVSGAQLLLYQKDLFEDEAAKIKFRRIYNENLTPPKTWSHFNMIAEFFTQSYNPTSPVKYGVSMVRGVNVFTTISFLNYLWAYGGQVFDSTGKPIIASNNSINALQSYCRSLSYSSGADNDSWMNVVEEFKQGSAAMTILYDSDIATINDRTSSKIAGNIGCSLIPGGTPVLGGWSLALNSSSSNINEAKSFLMWLLSDSNSIILPLLGGSSLRRSYYESSNLNQIQPWKNYVIDSFHQSISRFYPEIPGRTFCYDDIYTNIIPDEIAQVLNGTINEAEAINNMQTKLESIVK